MHNSTMELVDEPEPVCGTNVEKGFKLDSETNAENDNEDGMNRIYGLCNKYMQHI